MGSQLQASANDAPEYTDIDIVKTQALTVTRQERENAAKIKETLDWNTSFSCYLLTDKYEENILHWHLEQVGIVGGTLWTSTSYDMTETS